MSRSNVIPLRTCIEPLGTMYWRWFCWRCGRSGTARGRRTTAVKTLDRHVYMAHRQAHGVPYRPLEEAQPCS